MPYLIQPDELEKKTKNFKWSLPKIEGKFGASVFVGKKEFFIGLAVANVEIETVVRKKKIPVIGNQSKGKVRLFVPSA